MTCTLKALAGTWMILAMMLPAQAKDLFDQNDLHKNWLITGSGNGFDEYGFPTFCSFECIVRVRSANDVSGDCTIFIEDRPGRKVGIVSGSATAKPRMARIYAWFDLEFLLENDVTFQSRGRHQFVYEMPRRGSGARGPFVHFTGLWENSVGMVGTWDGKLSNILKEETN